MVSALKKLIKEDPPDAIHVDYLSMVLYRPVFNRVPAVCFPHDAVSMLMERNAQAETNFLRCLYMRAQWKKTVKFEAEWLPRFECTAVVSPVDRDHLLRHCPGLDITVTPNGVDGDYFAPLPLPVEEPSVLFRGVMNFLPNHDAALHFYTHILPKIRAEFPKTKFYLIGKNPSGFWLDQVQKDPLLVAPGYVEDLRPWMAKAGVIVVPMRIGSGIKNKILEPMAMGKAVVATPMSCAAIQAKNEENILLAEEPENFAGQVVRLLKDSGLRRRIGENARKFAVQNHSWERNARQYEALYQKAVEKRNRLHG